MKKLLLLALFFPPVPFGTFVQNVDYLECNSDYSDVVDSCCLSFTEISDVWTIAKNSDETMTCTEFNNPLLFNFNKTPVVEGTNILTQSMINRPNTIYHIRNNYDLNGAQIVIPKNCMLLFDNGGSLNNGTLVGQTTSIKAPCSVVFKRIVIQGSWNVDDIYSDWFEFDDNVIVDAASLCALSKENADIPIEPGSLFYQATRKCNIYINKDILYNPADGDLFVITRPADIFLASTITVIPNNLVSYSVFRIQGAHDVCLHGGKLVGDVNEHDYTQQRGGSQAHGIVIQSGRNIIIEDIESCYFPGDGIAINSAYDPEPYVYQKACLNIAIKNCKFHHNGRQGCSLTASIKGFLIDNCEFSHSGNATANPFGPWAGIDMEGVNEKCSQEDIVIRDSLFLENDGPQINGSTMYIRNVLIDNCIISAAERQIDTITVPASNGINFEYGEAVVINRCNIYGYVRIPAQNKSKDISFKNCKIEGTVFTLSDIESNRAIARFDECTIIGTQHYSRSVGSYFITFQGATECEFNNCKLYRGQSSGTSRSLWSVAHSNFQCKRISFVNCISDMPLFGTEVMNCTMILPNIMDGEEVPKFQVLAYGNKYVNNEYIAKDGVFNDYIMELYKVPLKEPLLSCIADINLIIKDNKFYGAISTVCPIDVHDWAHSLSAGYDRLIFIIGGNTCSGRPNIDYYLYHAFDGIIKPKNIIVAGKMQYSL